MGSAAKHIIFIVCIITLLVLCIVYPFLPGEYDPLALPISLIAQSIGVIGIPLAIIGVLWLLMPKFNFVFALISTVIGSFGLLIIALVATLSVGKSFGIIMLVWGAWLVVRLIPKIKRLKTEPGQSNVAGLYSIILPVSVLIVQVVLLKPVTTWSRNRAMENAEEYIADIEGYHTKYGQYPTGLQAQDKDYQPGVTGVEKYHYLAFGDSYNLSFEQPRFFFDQFGTREWVVYNPQDEHRSYSHTAWFMSFTPEQMNSTQGWYKSGNTNRAHWKYFLFD